MTKVNDAFKVGDKVYLLHKGVFGTVTDISDVREYDYPIKVEYVTKERSDGYDYFTLDGKDSTCHAIPMIYHDKVEFDFPKRKFTSKLAGKRVVVYHNHNNGPVIGKVIGETENFFTIDGRPALSKSGIITMYELGDQIQDW